LKISYNIGSVTSGAKSPTYKAADGAGLVAVNGAVVAATVPEVVDDVPVFTALAIEESIIICCFFF